MKVLFDTNIVLDVLLNRQAFVEHSAKLMGLVESQRIEGYLCATTLTTLDNLTAKSQGREKAKIQIKKLITLFQIAPVNHLVLNLALDAGFKDFEDSVQYHCAKCSNVEILVTRNTKDYKKATLPIYTPEELLNVLQGLS
ncbi:MAG: PIN domain-containing protein [Gammaproteobacteria bacterium]|nr:PIN domain-containing protein [Gammaproteobacteria bacterium]